MHPFATAVLLDARLTAVAFHHQKPRYPQRLRYQATGPRRRTNKKPLVVGSDGQHGADPILWLNLADPPDEEALADHEFAAVFFRDRHRTTSSRRTMSSAAGPAEHCHLRQRLP